MLEYYTNNSVTFDQVVTNGYGRQIIKTKQNKIDKNNIVDELSKALVVHNQNAVEINYLENYYRGDQPILYRKKDIRPEINNKIVENLAFMIVEAKTAEIVAEPIQYVLKGVDESKSEQINQLNKLMDEEDKHHFDIDLKRWACICGTAYRFIGNDEGQGRLLDESPFYLSVEDPRYTFVVYYQNGKPAFSCQIRENEKGNTVYNCYTDGQYFLIMDSKIVDEQFNANAAIPVVEYPNNSRRLSDIEITISLTDCIDKMASERQNGIDQFVQSFIKFVNCEIDEEEFKKMAQYGAFVVRSNNGTDNKADVDIMASELNQTESQVAVSDLYSRLLEIQGMASRQDAVGSDTGSAAKVRTGQYDSEKRAELAEPIFKRSERMMLRIVLNRLRIKNDFTLTANDIDIHISRSKMDNALTKAEVLQILLSCGVEESIAIKTVGLFADAEGTYLASKQRMSILYPKEIQLDTQVNV